MTNSKRELQNIEDILMLSPMQEGILFHYLGKPDSPEYFEQILLKLEGELEITAFEKAVNLTVQNNEMLRTVFRWKKIDKPVQIVLKEQEVQVQFMDLRKNDGRDGVNSQETDEFAWDSYHKDTVEIFEDSSIERRLEEIMEDERNKLFDLEVGPLFRVHILRLDVSKVAVLFSYHHILWDGWSTGVILKEILSNYESLISSAQIPKGSVKRKFKEYLRWLKNRKVAAEQAFWKKYLEGIESQTQLPSSPFPRFNGSGIGEYELSLPASLVESVTDLARNIGVTVPALINTAWGILLMRYNNVDDVLFGVTVSGRPAEVSGVEEMVGLFINTLPLRVQNSADLNVAQLAKAVHESVNQMKGFEQTPLVEIKAQSELAAGGGMFDSIVVVENYPLDEALKGVTARVRLDSYETFEATNFALTLVVTMLKGIDLKWIYQKEQLDSETVARLSRILCQILQAMISNAECRVKELNLLTFEDEELLGQFNPLSNEVLPNDLVILDIFAQRVKEMPDAVALVYGEDTVTYQELNQRAGQVACALQERGVGLEEIVAIMVEPSVELVVGIFGILQAGGAYLPIDPRTPEDRILYMLEDSGARVLLTQEKFQGKVQDVSQCSQLTMCSTGDELYLTSMEDSISSRSIKSGTELPRVKPANLAYVIYTSGSTGKPKGVLVEHQSLLNLLIAMEKDYPITSKGTWLLKTPYTFDVSLTEIFGWILGGARLAILEPEGEKEPQKIIEAIERYQVTHLNFVPSMYNVFMDYLEITKSNVLAKLRYLMVAGEAISIEQVKRLYRSCQDVEFINLYGPTEATVYATHFPLKNAQQYKSVPIGRGLANARLHVLNSAGLLQPIGFPGELCIAGECLGRGYLNRPELTQEKFTTHPKFGRIYRTGDLVRWLPDGNIEFLGRMDYQVKIRGYRIEIGEIENQLLSHQQVKEAVVVDRTDQRGMKYLCGYVVLRSGEVGVEELKAYLAKRMPEYMIPAYMVPLQAMPLTPSGKLSRKALPEPTNLGQAKVEWLAPRNELEEQLVHIWQDVLGVEKIGVTDQFFLLGGHSLKAIQLTARIFKEIGVEISVNDIFQALTVEQTARLIANRQGGGYAEIAQQPVREYYPASSAQKRLYLIQQMEPQSLAYNMPMVFIVRGTLERGHFTAVMQRLVERHESLRTEFAFVEGEVVQKVRSEVDFQVEYAEELPESRRVLSDSEVVQQQLADFLNPFDLAKAPLMRVKLVRVAEDEHLLLVDMHHIISDGASLRVFVEEFAQAYSEQPLPELRLQYRDYTMWQMERMKGTAIAEHEAFWLKELAGEVQSLNLPMEKERGRVLDWSAGHVDFALTADITSELKVLAEKEGVTLFTLLMSLYGALLARYTGQEDMIIGTPVEGRNHPDLRQIIGMFVNTLAFRLKPQGGLSFVEYLREMKTRVLNAFEHQDYPYEMLVEALDLGQSPLFDTMFTFQDLRDEEVVLQASGLNFEYMRLPQPVAKYPLLLIAEEAESGLRFRFEFVRELFNEDTLVWMGQHFTALVRGVLAKPDCLMRELEVLGEEEKSQLIYGFNNTTTVFPREKTVTELFREQVERVPERIAVRYRDMSLTYSELNGQANRIARFLQIRGVQVDELVGILVSPGLEMMVGILGILKAGAAYLPLDANLPYERVRFMLQDAGVRMILTQGEFGEFLHEMLVGTVGLPDDTETSQRSAQTLGEQVDVVFFEDFYSDEPQINTESAKQGACNDVTHGQRSGYTAGGVGSSMLADLAATDLPVIATPENLAYVMYTSGSTGQPKGVMIPHRGIVRLLFNTNYISIAEERFLQMSPYTFDASTFNIWGALLFGGELVMVDKDLLLSNRKLAETMREEGIQTCFMTTALFNQMIDETPEAFGGLKRLYVGGETLSIAHMRKALQTLPNTLVYNVYGPTESTTFATYHLIEDVEDGRLIPIGKPISNTRAYIFDQYLRLQPVGVQGEIYLAGEGLARGYLNRAELTAERFILNPHVYGELLYKTGDLGRFLPDGSIEFLGRKDQQVKIRGFRIELPEIEVALLRQPQVKQAFVQVRLDARQDKYLAAYLVAEGTVRTEDLRRGLLQVLPEYMVPNAFVQLKNLPLNANGKVDGRALPEPADYRVDREYVAPRTELEAKIAEIYAQVLQVSQVGVSDDFFLLGGHSLKAAQLSARIAQELGVELSLRELFQNPVVEDLAAVIANLNQYQYQPIPPEPEAEHYPLSPAQNRIFILHQMGGGGIEYNIPSVMVMQGNLDTLQFQQALSVLFKRHETLRTIFTVVDGVPVQKILSHVEIRLEEEDLQGKADGQDSLEALVQARIQDFIQPFDLAQAPLLRVKLLKLEPQKWLLLFDMHHIISDGLSMEILVSELTEIYAGKNPADLQIQYRDYAVWQNKRLNSEILYRQRKYWQENLAQELPVLQLPTDYPRPAVQKYHGQSYHVTIEANLTEKLRALMAEEGVTLFMLFFGAYNVLLTKLSGQEDLIVGTPVSGRVHPDVEQVIGVFINTLALRSKPAGEHSFKDFLREIKTSVLQAFENQEYPFEMLVEDLKTERDLSRHPLFDTMFDVQNLETGRDGIELPELSLRPYQFDQQISKFDLNLTVQEYRDHLGLVFTYSTALFKEESIARFARYFTKVLETIIANPAIGISKLSLLSDAEREQIILGFNQTQRQYPEGQLLHQIFEEYVKIQPEEAAVIVGGKQLSYAELNARANQVAHLLRQRGVNAETLVGIMVERSFEMIIGVLAVFKAGGAYVPIDPAYPEDRISYMLKDSGAKILLTQSGLRRKVGIADDAATEGYSGETIFLDQLSTYGAQSTTNLENKATPENLAYLIYTSGSTGRPKGVMVEHRNLLNSHYSWQDQFELKDGRPVLLQLASFSFDVFIADICRSIGSGGTMVIAAEERGSLPLMYQLFIKHQVTIVNSTPGLLLPLMEYVQREVLPLPSLRYLLIGADSWHMRDYRWLLKNFGEQFKVANCYGVTEAAVDATWFNERDSLPLSDGLVPIGKPIYNVQLYILDKYREPVPQGVVGEVYIGGPGVARDYLNRPDLTAERFIPDHFAHHFNRNNARLYKTGDLGRYLADGNIEFLGRSDNQVKVRGYRIEIGEIEAAILRQPAITNAVVIAPKGNDGTRYLSAYITTNLPINPSDVRGALTRELPEFMVPDYITVLDSFPLTPNGKVDLRGLPEVQMEKHYVAPSGEVEIRLAKIWEEVLQVAQVGRDDNFFKLGGHSLKGMLMLARVYKEFLVEVPLRQLFAHPVLHELAVLLHKADGQGYAVIPVQEAREYYPLSSAQKRLFILHQFEPANLSYNMPAALRVTGRLEIERLKQVLAELVARHESLRTSFALADGEPVQRVAAAVHVDVELKHYHGEDWTGWVEVEIGKFIRPFDLRHAPLLRVGVLQRNAEDYLLLLDMHHIISDGVSVDILVREMGQLYAGEILPDLRVQYKDFAVWQNELLVSDAIQDAKTYWVNKFSGDIPVLNLPTDYPRPVVQSTDGDNYHFILPEELGKGVQRLATDTGATLYMVLLAAYSILLAKYSGQTDVCIGSPVAGRSHPDAESMVGMFVNTLALRNAPVSEKSLREFLAEVKADTLSALEYQDYPFEMLIDMLKLERDLGRNPLFDVAFVLQNTENLRRKMEFAGLELGDYPLNFRQAKFDLTLVAEEWGESIECTWNYCAKLFKTQTIERLAVHLEKILQVMVNDLNSTIGALEILTEEEKDVLLYGFNQAEREYPLHLTVDSLIEAQVVKQPEAVAVQYGTESLTYRELAQRSSEVAECLRQQGIGVGDIVVVLADRSLELMVAIVGVLKVGAAYLPINPEYPVERIRFMLTDSRARVILTQPHLQRLVDADEYASIVVVLSPEGYTTSEDTLTRWSESALVSCSTALQPKHTSSDLAYIIYTSGSTGRPKGVMIEHRALVNFLYATYDNYRQRLGYGDRMLSLTNISFDVSVFEMFLPLVFGAALVLYENRLVFDVEGLAQTLLDEEITMAYIPPTLLKDLHNALERRLQGQKLKLQNLLVGVEPIKDYVLEDYVRLNPDMCIVNGYGPTEATICATEHIYTAHQPSGRNVPIGKPLANTRIVILDRENHLVPIGVQGELCVSGEGLARGYLHRADITAEKFTAHPYWQNERMYRTGDLARWLSDGTIEFVGRVDYQVKIRGYRIEPGEIETQLLTLNGIKETVVVAKENSDGVKYLTAYFTADRVISVGELRAHLLQTLPDYMVPAYFIQLSALPLTPNGKVDRKALPEPEGRVQTGKEYVAPKNELEQQLAGIWSRILRIEGISTTETFFELGGNSLQLIKVYEELKTTYPGIELNVADLFSSNTVAQLAELISQQLGGQEETDDGTIEEFSM